MPLRPRSCRESMAVGIESVAVEMRPQPLEPASQCWNLNWWWTQLPCGSCDKLSQTRWLYKAVYSLTVLGMRSLKSRCGQGPTKALRRIFLCFFSFCWLPLSFTCGCITPISALVCTGPSPLCLNLPLPLSYKDNSHCIYGPVYLACRMISSAQDH